MLARYEVRIFQNGVRLRSDEKGRSVGHGRTLIIILTAVYLLWLFVRIISQPEWLAQLPVSFLELLRLAQLRHHSVNALRHRCLVRSRHDEWA